jgi:ADP-heptose:LPS heptosyltransferase
LVIAVDTAVAHLAASLGKPTWVLVSYAPDWRWLYDRSDSPWYPSVRIFRQKTPGDWVTVIQQVTEELSLLTNQRNLPSDAQRSSWARADVHSLASYQVLE